MTPPAEPLSPLHAETIRATMAPGDYTVRRDTSGRAWTSGRCAWCHEPVGEAAPSVEYHGLLFHAGCYDTADVPHVTPA